MADAFTIIEERQTGDAFETSADGEVFTWTAAAHTIPERPWTLGGEQRSSRTDYPGGAEVTEQVLGPVHRPQTLRGEWKDHWNYSGFAAEEMRRFEAMCRRGNPIQISFQRQAFRCLIKDWAFDYQRKEKIGYQFTVSVLERTDEPEKATPPDRDQILSPIQVAKDIEVPARGLEEATRENPAISLKGGAADETLLAMERLSANLTTLSGRIQESQTPGLSQIEQYKRIATQARIVAGDAFNITTALVSVRSDVELGVQTLQSLFDFEVWSRSTRFQARLLMGQGSRAARAMERRADPKTVKVYRPHSGQSLYDVSNRFYGTPHGWRAIADRNGLQTLTLTGEEELIIPERGAG